MAFGKYFLNDRISQPGTLIGTSANGMDHSKLQWSRAKQERRQEKRERRRGGRGRSFKRKASRGKAQSGASGWTGAAAFKPPYALEPSGELLKYIMPTSARGRSNSIPLGCGSSSIICRSFPCDSDLQPGVRSTLLGHLFPEIRLTSNPAVRLMHKELLARISNPNRMCGREHVRQQQQTQKISQIFSYCPTEHVVLTNKREWKLSSRPQPPDPTVGPGGLLGHRLSPGSPHGVNSWAICKVIQSSQTDK